MTLGIHPTFQNFYLEEFNIMCSGAQVKYFLYLNNFMKYRVEKLNPGFFYAFEFMYMSLTWLCCVLVVAWGVFQCPLWAICCFGQASLEWRTGSVLMAHGLSCPATCGVFVPEPGIKPTSSTLECGFLTRGPPGTSQTVFIVCFCLSLMHFLGLRSLMFYST